MINDIYLEYDAFLRSFKRNKDVPHSFLLGAGTSVSSGIQSAYDCVWEWKKDIYLSQNINASEYYKNYKDESVRKSIQNWLDNEGIYPKLDSPEEYSFYAEKAYPISDDRRKYFFNLMEEKEPYIGYKILCLLAKQGIVKAIWTTNFDGLMTKAAYQNKLTPIEVTLDNVDNIFRNQSTKELLTIALHGDYKYSTLKNIGKELDVQNDIFIEYITNYHIDKNMIVIGYSGRDKSLMQALENAFTKKGAGRLYWCGYGDNIKAEIYQLLNRIRNAGREAYYISADGFDKTLIHLSKSVFEDKPEILSTVQKAIEITEGVDEYIKTDFHLPFQRTDKYIKSNLHPIVFPKEVFQFEIDYQNKESWSFLASVTENTNVCAVPFRKKVFALGTLTDINNIFKGRIKSEIKREPISRNNIENISAFKSLMLKAILKFFSLNPMLETNLKSKIWKKSVVENFTNIDIHDAVSLSLYFDKNINFAYLTFIPTVYLTSSVEISKKQWQLVSKNYLEKLYNDKYDEILESWNTLLFNQQRLNFEFPIQSGTGFEFQISKNTAFGEINVLDTNYRGYQLQNYNSRQTQFRGVQFLEPQLIFRNAVSNNEFKDYHPMRGLVNHRPYDVILNGTIFSNEITLSVICSNRYSNKFYDFLLGLQTKSIAEINVDYLIDYPGFLSVYNIPINISTTDSWTDISFVADDKLELHVNVLKLARQITSKINQIINTQSQNTIVIFIPNEWQPFERYINHGETFDLHDYVKAYAASIGVSTQLIREETLKDTLKCQIYWWLSLSFYVKAMRTPWILNNQEKNTAYAGIGYSVSTIKSNSEIVIGCSHIYDSNGQGLRYKLSKIDDYYLDKQKNPYLSYKDAFQFGVSIR
jgi:NAD-dependent SIR2 family protein deacetylase